MLNLLQGKKEIGFELLAETNVGDLQQSMDLLLHRTVQIVYGKAFCLHTVFFKSGRTATTNN